MKETMRKMAGIGILALVGLVASWSLWGTSVSFLDLITHPLRSLWGSQQQLNSGLLEVSESLDPVRAASRRLLKPFGMVRVIRTFPTNKPSTDQSPPGGANSSKPPEQ